MSGGEQYDRFDLYENYGPTRRDTIAIVQLGPSNAPATGTIVDVASYAITPDGKRRGVQTEPYDYDIQPDRLDPGVPNIRTALYLVDPAGRRDGSAWKTGNWEFFLTLDTPHGRERREFDVKLRKPAMSVWWIWQAPN